MTDFLEFAFDDGTVVAVQAFAPAVQDAAAAEADGAERVPGFGPSRPVAAGSRLARVTGRTLRGVLTPLVPVLQSVHDTVASAAAPPDQLTVTLGVRIGNDLKIAVVGASGEASLAVTATWNLTRAPEAPGAGAATAPAPGLTAPAAGQ